MARRIHIIDPNSRRRASIAREFLGRNLHAEIYEDLAEFCKRAPTEGFVFAVDQPIELEPTNLFDSMRNHGCVLAVALYSATPLPERIVQAMLMGALDYLQWPFERQLLNSALERLGTDGERLMRQEQRRSTARSNIGKLSAREREVLLSMLRGNSNKDIGVELGISPRTVEIHRANMMRRLDSSSTPHAVRMALDAGLDPDLQP